MIEAPKKDPALCLKMTADLNATGPYGVTWKAGDSCAYTMADKATIMVYHRDLVEMGGAYIAEVARKDDTQLARLTDPDLMALVHRAKNIADIFSF